MSEQLHLAVELKVSGVHDGQVTGLQHAKSEGSERFVERDALVVVGRVGHDSVHGLVCQVREHLPEVARPKLPRVAGVLGRAGGRLGPPRKSRACSMRRWMQRRLL